MSRKKEKVDKPCNTSSLNDKLKKYEDQIKQLKRIFISEECKLDKIQKKINNINIDDKHHVPYLGGYSKNGNTIYIDSRFPKEIILDGKKTIDTHKYLVIHEVTEKHLEDIGLNYNEAHNIAEATQEAALHLDGHNPEDYYGVYYVTYNQILRDFDPQKVPQDLDLKPYKDDKLSSVLDRIQDTKAMKKSNYGPKEYGLYDRVSNIKRKENRTSEEVPDAGKNVAVHRFTSANMGTAKQQADQIAMEDKIRNKAQPVRTEMTPEERAKYEAQYNAPKQETRPPAFTLKQDIKRASEDGEELIDEHVRLVHVLKHGSLKERIEEYEKQLKELRDLISKDMKKSESYFEAQVDKQGPWFKVKGVRDLAGMKDHPLHNKMSGNIYFLEGHPSGELGVHQSRVSLREADDE